MFNKSDRSLILQQLLIMASMAAPPAIGFWAIDFGGAGGFLFFY
jgi:hypothetical protein